VFQPNLPENSKISMASDRSDSTVIKLLNALQKHVAAREKAVWEEEDCISFIEVQDLVQIEYFGFACGESFSDLIHLLCNPDIASSVQSLAFRSVDEGFNGTLYWDFTELNRSSVMFPNLTTFFVEPQHADCHNGSVIAQMLEEEGMIGRLLAQMPNLREMTVPNAPDASFFQVGQRPLSALRVEAGYDHQNFIFNFSRSSCFPFLKRLDFGDFNEQYMDDYLEYCTPFEHYRDLLQSKALSGVQELVLRNARLSPSQVEELQKLCENIIFRLIDT
jgi:hypothetical protein